MSQGSMSVSSLIDRFSSAEGTSDQKQPNARRPPDAKNTLDKTGLLSLLGPNVTSFPFSEDAYVETIKLRAEQEKTKQEYYKLELANKNIAILQMALQAKIPSHMIPSMCVGSLSEQQTEPQVEKSPSDFGRSRRHSKATASDLMSSDAYNTNPVAPINYRFGEGSNPVSGRRSLSPAKIGAAAVANLATPTTPYKSSSMARRIPSHQRHFSMPAEGYGNRNRYSGNDPTGSQRKLRASTSGSSSLSVSQSQDNVLLKSPLGSTALLQVKPSPAQPLNRQSKSNKPPSQESMTSFQHVIQFHHWKPEAPGANAIPNTLTPSSYKRHKSDSMSVDMTNVISDAKHPDIRIEVEDTGGNTSGNEQRHDNYGQEDDNDITMDTSVSEEAPLKGMQQGDAGSNLNIGRYPHDILSSSK